MTNNDFLPQDYTAPQGNSNYLKLEKGETKVRIMSKPIVGWLDWKDKKPMRFPMANKPQPTDATKPVKHFWAFIVFDYKANDVKVMEVTQKSIQTAISDLSNDTDWGSPLNYDIKITRKGDGMETEYTINPVVPKVLTKEQKDAFTKKPINLNALYEGKDPFELSAGTVNDMPF